MTAKPGFITAFWDIYKQVFLCSDRWIIASHQPSDVISGHLHVTTCCKDTVVRFWTRVAALGTCMAALGHTWLQWDMLHDQQHSCTCFTYYSHFVQSFHPPKNWHHKHCRTRKWRICKGPVCIVFVTYDTKPKERHRCQFRQYRNTPLKSVFMIAWTTDLSRFMERKHTS